MGDDGWSNSISPAFAAPEDIWTFLHKSGFVLFGVAEIGRSNAGLCRAMDFMFARADGDLIQLAYQHSGKASGGQRNALSV